MNVVSAVSELGVTERRADFPGSAGDVPGILWAPEEASGPRPVVLLGHGGTQHKRARGLRALLRPAPGQDAGGRRAGVSPPATGGPGAGVLGQVLRRLGAAEVDRRLALARAALPDAVEDDARPMGRDPAVSCSGSAASGPRTRRRSGRPPP